MNNIEKRFSAVLLAALTLFMFAACGESAAVHENEAVQNDTDTEITTEGETEPPYAFLVSPPDFGGREFLVMNGAFTTTDYIDLDDSVKRGDIIVEAIYDRNLKTEELLNVSIRSNTIDWKSVGKEVNEIVLAGENSYSAVFGSVEMVSRSLDKHFFVDLNEIDSIDMENPWWDREINDVFGFGTGKAYLACGEINYWDDLATICLYFNKDLFSANGIQYPYDDVRSGTWTCEDLRVLINDAYMDLNGNGEDDLEDQYGYVCTASHAFNMMIGFGESTVVRNSDNQYEFILDEDYFTKFTHAINDFCNTPATIVVERKYGYGVPIFELGRTFFNYANIGSCLDFRSLEFDIGVLPYPKFTEDQDRYHCVCNTQYANVYTVPVSSDAEFAGAVLEAMGWFAMPQLKEAVIDTSVLVKGVRDEDSYDMFMTIFDAKTYELIYNFNWGRYYSETTSMVISGTDNLASVFAKVREATDTQMCDFIEAVRSDS